MLPYKSSSHSATTAVTDSLDFRVADAPLQIQFASAKCVRCASLRSGGRRLAVRTAMEHPICALPRTPFPASRDFPSRGNEGHGEKNRRVIYFMYHSNVSPFGALRHHLSPASGGTITRAYCRAIYEESVSQCFILPPLAGEVRRSRIGGVSAEGR